MQRPCQAKVIFINIRGQFFKEDQKCFKCHQRGHLEKDCRGSRSRSRDRSRGRSRSRSDSRRRSRSRSARSDSRSVSRDRRRDRKRSESSRKSSRSRSRSNHSKGSKREASPNGKHLENNETITNINGNTTK